MPRYDARPMTETAAGSHVSRQHFERQYRQVLWATVLVPLVLSWTFGFLADEEWPYFFGVTLLSCAPPIFGLHDLFFEAAEWIERRRKAEIERLRWVAILAEDSGAFRATIQRLNHDELWHLSRSIVDRRPGFTLDLGNPALATLLDCGLIQRSRHFRADGYPYFIPDRAWVLLCALADEVLYLRDRKGPNANSLAPGHVPEELPLLFPERYRRRDPLTWRRVGTMAAKLAEHVALGIASLSQQVAFATVFWAVAIAGLVGFVLLLVTAGWIIGAIYGWLFG